MDPRLEEIARAGELAAEYVGDVLEAAVKAADRLMDDLATLAENVIEEGSKVVAAALDAFLPEEPR